jgi:hypothetical protein
MQHEARLLQEPVFLCRVAPTACGYDVVPGVQAPTTLRHDVIDVLGGSAAVLAAMAIAGEHRSARDRNSRLARNPHVLAKSDN